jgi:hypothetical protein
MDMGPGKHRRKPTGRHRAPWYKQIDRYAQYHGKSLGTFGVVFVGSTSLLLTLAGSGRPDQASSPLDVLPVTVIPSPGVTPRPQPTEPRASTGYSFGPAQSPLRSRPGEPSASARQYVIPESRSTAPRTGSPTPSTSAEPSPSPSASKSTVPADPPEMGKRYKCRKRWQSQN